MEKDFKLSENAIERLENVLRSNGSTLTEIEAEYYKSLAMASVDYANIMAENQGSVHGCYLSEYLSLSAEDTGCFV